MLVKNAQAPSRSGHKACVGSVWDQTGQGGRGGNLSHGWDFSGSLAGGQSDWGKKKKTNSRNEEDPQT